MNEPKIETVRFPNGHEALLAHVDQDTPANAVIAALKLPQPNALACLNGGTAELSDDLKADLSRLLADGLARVAAENAMTLLTGGTDAGIFSVLGEGLAKWERKAPCIGVTPAVPVTWPGRDQGDTPLEPHHSHFVVVEGKEWGDETTMMYSVAQALSSSCPSIAVFAGGGDVTLREMQANVDHGREMILVAGSGRKTDAVLDILAGSNTSDRALQGIASKGRITRFEIHGSPEQFARLIESRILPAC